MRFNCPKDTRRLTGSSLLFTTKFSEIPGTHLIDIGRMKGRSTLEPTSGFEHGNPWIGNPAP